MADLIVIILIALLLTACIRTVFAKDAGCGCSGNCASCTLACSHGLNTNRTCKGEH